MCIGVKEHVCWHEWHVMLWHSPVVFFLGQALSPAWDGEDGKRERLPGNFETWHRKPNAQTGSQFRTVGLCDDCINPRCAAFPPPARRNTMM